jgi:hypothetical protein
MKSCSDHMMRVPLQGCPKSECRLTCVRMQWVHWTNRALCPLLAVSCDNTGLALFTMTLSSPRMDYSHQPARFTPLYSTSLCCAALYFTNPPTNFLQTDWTRLIVWYSFRADRIENTVSLHPSYCCVMSPQTWRSPLWSVHEPLPSNGSTCCSNI